MIKFESSIKQIPHSQEQVYNKLQDLSNLSSLQDKLEGLRDKIGDQLQNMEFDSDSLTLTVQGMTVTLRITEREPCKCIKLEGDKSPVPLNLWIQILSVSEEQAKLKVTIGAEVNMFMKAMVSKPLQEGAEKIAEMLSMIPY